MNAKLWLITAGVLLVHLTLLEWLRPNPAASLAALPPLQVSLLPAPTWPAVTAPAPVPRAPAQPDRRATSAHRAQAAGPIVITTAPSATLAQPQPFPQTANLLDPSPGQETAKQPATSIQTPSDTQTTATGASPAVASPRTASTPVRTLPSASADYLDNPPPPYPPLSRRLGEQGTALVRTLISRNGRALDAVLAQSSGFDRLDQAAVQAVKQWRYRPATLDGVAQEMWFDVPVSFHLN